MPPKKRQTAARAGATASLDPSKLKVAQLKNELEKRGLDSSGKKADLVSRLEDALSGPPPTKKTKVSTDDSDVVDFSKMKVAELREECENRGLDSSGKKAKLVSRLQANATGGGAISTAKAEGGKKASKPETGKAKEEESQGEEETDYSKAKRALKTSESAAKKKKHQPKVDSQVPLASTYQVEGEWDCMLNQTNIGHNNNKYYIIQMLRRQSLFHATSGSYYVWNRWGRVGEPGQNAMKGPFSSVDAAAKEFKKKFTDKTKNKWEERDKFVPVAGKYTLIEMDADSDGEEELAGKLAALEETDAPAAPSVVKPCSLDRSTQDLVKLMFNNDMFKEAMQSMEIDTRKMPLGKLSKVQIAKGFEALEAIEDALKSGASSGKLSELTSKFYTIIPHDFGRKVPPVIRDPETLQKKFDMLLVLGDIEIAQGIERDKEKKQKEAGGEVPHPLDLNYELLKANLVLVDRSGDEFRIIEKYLRATEPYYTKIQIMDVWKVDRQGVDDRFKEHDSLDNRRLLWHGTNVAVVAAILKSGLRIMPHSGGRVGKGIYFASENSKSAGYVRRAAGNIGIMFLNEVALGKEHHITRDDSSLTTPPKGFDCVIAKGRTEPDPKDDTAVTLGGRNVAVPQGKPISMPQYSSSSFSQSEYLVYKESQARIRYLLKLKF